jgi:hypothetical protein
MYRFAKSTPPSSIPTGGMMMSFTSEFTTAPSATPMMTANASASTFCLMSHARKPPMESSHRTVWSMTEHNDCQAGDVDRRADSAICS